MSLLFPLPNAARKSSRVLFVCGSNAAWSIMAEAMLNRVGGSRFHALSAGLDPARAVDGLALEQLAIGGFPVEHCFTKPVQGFREESLIALDFVIAAMDLNEIGLSRGWPGNPLLVHWRIPDPMDFHGRGNGRRNQFRSVFTSLFKRVNLMVALPPEKIALLAVAKDPEPEPEPRSWPERSLRPLGHDRRPAAILELLDGSA
jgi:protein-tyrosine-phosphatase